MSAQNNGPAIIMHLAASNFYGGPERQIIEHIRRLDRLIYLGIVASFLEGGNENELLQKAEACGMPFFGLPMKGPLDPRGLWQLIRLLKQERVDLLCTHGYKATIMGWLVGRFLKIPILAFSRGYTWENPKVSSYEWLERLILGRTAGIICVSRGQQGRLEALGVKCSRIWVVHNAVATREPPEQITSEFRNGILARLGIPQDSRLVVSAGRLSREKGHRFLIEAVARMGSRGKGAHYVFCGDGPCREDLLVQATALGIANKCHFPGFRYDIDEIFQTMDLFVLPSLTEGLPNVILESFAHAKPVVAAAVGGVPELVEDGFNGLLVPSACPDSLAKAIETCLSTPEWAHCLGKAGWRKVKRDFTFESQSKKLEQAYEVVLESST